VAAQCSAAAGTQGKKGEGFPCSNTHTKVQTQMGDLALSAVSPGLSAEQPASQLGTGASRTGPGNSHWYFALKTFILDFLLLLRSPERAPTIVTMGSRSLQKLNL